METKYLWLTLPWTFCFTDGHNLAQINIQIVKEIKRVGAPLLHDHSLYLDPIEKKMKNIRNMQQNEMKPQNDKSLKVNNTVITLKHFKFVVNSL